jgi:hypothetical protein
MRPAIRARNKHRSAARLIGSTTFLPPFAFCSVTSRLRADTSDRRKVVTPLDSPLCVSALITALLRWRARAEPDYTSGDLCRLHRCGVVRHVADRAPHVRHDVVNGAPIFAFDKVHDANGVV